MAERTPIGVDELDLDDAALEALAEAHATPPPPHLRDRVLDEVLRTTVVWQRRTLTRWRAIGAVAALVVLALGGLLAGAFRQRGELAMLRQANTDLMARLEAQSHDLAALQASLAAQTQILRVMGGPRTVTAALAPKAGVTASGRVVVDQTSGEAAVVITNLGPAGAGKTYELWAIRGSQPPEPAGTFAPTPEHTVAARSERIPRPSEVTVFAVSIEPAGGSTSPTGPIVLAGAVAG